MQAQNTTNQPAAKLSITNPPVIYVDHVLNEQHKHEHSLGPSATISKSTKKHHLKLKDPPAFTDGKNSIFIKYWLVKMKSKMAANNNIYDILKNCMIYVINYVKSLAFSHLELHI